MMQEIYLQKDITADSQIPQHSMKIERKVKQSSSTENFCSENNMMLDENAPSSSAQL